MQAIIFIGIQGTGKSSFYRERFFRTHIRLSLDMLRTRNRERLLIAACLEAKQPFVVDNTNVVAADRAPLIAGAKSHGFEVQGYYFRSDVKSALERNGRREGKERVPDKGVLSAYKRLEIPTLQEGFDSLYYVTMDNDFNFRIEEWSDEVR